ncbi:hypothetical protein [Sideroxyarcus emersonii]|uniref:hypothetical protein n=1 Tax=Sideroxyarcus emersonii TaxID=2764705 RepID=UPI001F1E0DAD|nr:hypothetical protein [Sideroxyarcus emersonii]
MSPIVESLLLRSFVIFLMVGGLAGLVVGVLLIFSPHRISAIGIVLNRWISTRHINQALDRTVTLDPWFYRHHRTSAGLILLAAGYILYAFTVGLDRHSAVIEFARRFNLPAGLASGLLDGLVLATLLGALLAIFVSLFLLLRPSLLRDFEQASNRWISLRKALKPMEIRRTGLDEYVLKHARQAGILLMIGSLYVLALLATWIGH